MMKSFFSEGALHEGVAVAPRGFGEDVVGPLGFTTRNLSLIPS